MKRIAWLFLVVLGSALLVQAQSSSNSMTLRGTICQSTCVTQVDNRSTCDKDCTDKSGDAVLVTDQGEVKQVANQDMCKSHMGKHVKMRATSMGFPSEKSREETIRIEELNEEGGAG